MLLSHHQNAGPNHDIKIANRCFENLAQFRYLATTVTNQNLIHEKITRRLNSDSACHHSVQKLLSSCRLSKKIKIRIYRTIIFPVVLYGCETWSLILWEEHRPRVFENRVLGRLFGPKMDEVTGDCGKLHTGRVCSMNGEKRNAYSILVGKLQGKRPLEYQDVGRWINIKKNLRERGWGGTDWIDVVQDRDQWWALVNMVMNLLVP
jgi:hypothetical protein